MSQKSIKQNAIFNILYKTMIYIFPLLIAGYVGRVLSPEGVGKISFVQNITSYFTLAVALGIPTYGTREIAKCRTLSERNKVFSSLFVINAVSTVIFSICFYSMILFLPFFERDRFLYAITGIQILFNFINIDWLYQGLEEYKYIAVRSLMTRVVSTICIFMFVKSKEDTWIYIALITLVNVGNYLFNAIHARGIVKITLQSIECKKHLYSIFVLLATVIAIELYTKVDTTFIGLLLNEEQVGYYTYANKIIQILITIFAAINAVALPRLSQYHNQNDKESFGNLIKKISLLILVISIPAMVGIFVLSNDIVVLLFGESFLDSGILLRFLSPLIVIMAIGNLYGAQAIIAIGEETRKFKATVLAAVINCIATPILLIFVGTKGACIASVFSELIVLLIYLRIINQYNKIIINRKDLLYILLSSLIMAVVLIQIINMINNIYLRVIISVFAGIGTYGVLLLLNSNMRIQFCKILFLKNRERSEGLK